MTLAGNSTLTKESVFNSAAMHVLTNYRGRQLKKTFAKSECYWHAFGNHCSLDATHVAFVGIPSPWDDAIVHLATCHHIMESFVNASLLRKLSCKKKGSYCVLVVNLQFKNDSTCTREYNG